MTLVFDSKQKCIKFQYHEETMNKKEDELCCSLQTCWRHHVEKIKLEKFEENEEKSLRPYIEKYCNEVEDSYSERWRLVLKDMKDGCL
ncbi:hypothetical protein O6P43_021995 [Quillaja saponaria]|uniref:Uncharacterized protein n=1 Tax=Quillaja saponaria TaxID=32244 RepID=A0AAD7LC60_QUISA|nr:hypothetical protein O6P43_021995 [Quillaja saponaria]